MASWRDEIRLHTGRWTWKVAFSRHDFGVAHTLVTEFHYQHHVRLHGSSHISLFDNGASNFQSVESSARGLFVELDTATMSATIVKEWHPVYKNFSVSQGNIQIMDNRNVVIGYGV